MRGLRTGAMWFCSGPMWSCKEDVLVSAETSVREFSGGFCSAPGSLLTPAIGSVFESRRIAERNRRLCTM